MNDVTIRDEAERIRGIAFTLKYKDLDTAYTDKLLDEVIRACELIAGEATKGKGQ